MVRKIKLDDKEYDIENLSSQAQTALALLQFSTERMKELSDLQAVLNRAKNSYLESLKREVLSSKSGFLLDDD